MDESRRNRPPHRRPQARPVTADPHRRDPISLDGIAADEHLIQALANGHRRPGDVLAELLGAWLDDINTDSRGGVMSAQETLDRLDELAADFCPAGLPLINDLRARVAELEAIEQRAREIRTWPARAGSWAAAARYILGEA